jgi:hypothetical protein
VDFAAAVIAEAGDLESLRQAAKLMKVDEKRFDKIVLQIFATAQTRRNPFIHLRWPTKASISGMRL